MRLLSSSGTKPAHHQALACPPCRSQPHRPTCYSSFYASLSDRCDETAPRLEASPRCSLLNARTSSSRVRRALASNHPIINGSPPLTVTRHTGPVHTARRSRVIPACSSHPCYFQRCGCSFPSTSRLHPSILDLFQLWLPHACPPTASICLECAALCLVSLA